MQWTEIIANQDLRREAGRLSLQAFGLIYLSEYFSYKSPDYQKLYCQRLQDDKITRLAECDFRESGKSVWASLVLPLWNICYRHRHFIVVGGETKSGAIMHLSNMINVLQTGELIIKDFGKLYKSTEKEEEVTRKKTVNDFITENNVRVLAKGRGESVRGLRHLKYRPELFIGDDLDSNNTVINHEQRDKLYNWFKGEVLSGINQEYGKVVVVGNMIHFDCIMARLKKDKTFFYNEVPIYKGDQLAWASRHFWTEAEAIEYNKDKTNKEDKRTSIEKIKEDKGSLIFAQEYLLQPMAENDRIFKPEWIKYYDELPRVESLVFKGRIDPSAKEKETSDYSAIAIGARDVNTGKIYIVDVWQGKCSEKEKANKIYEKHRLWDTQEFIVEDNAYQDVLRQRVADMADQGKYVPVRGETTVKDKITRALSIQPYIERGDVLFNPRLNEMTKISGDARSQGAIDQMTEFPLSLNDDMVDAIIGVIENFTKNKNLNYTTNEDTGNLTANLMEKVF